MKSTLTRLRKFAGLDFAGQTLLLRALIWVAAIRTALWLLPFRTVRQCVTRASKPTATNPCLSINRITQAVEIAARRIPAATCLTQAFAAQILLARAGHPSTLRIGVLPTESRLKAHAWVECDGRIVIGDVPEIGKFAVLPKLSS